MKKRMEIQDGDGGKRNRMYLCDMRRQDCEEWTGEIGRPISHTRKCTPLERQSI